tara:strand:- start:54 stop:536 length:483 start_codon:yes stop_codon:yes gene_type:complete
MLELILNWKVFKKAEVIHIFISTPDEPDTRAIIEHCWNSGKIVAVPLVLPNTFDLFHSEIKSFDSLIPGIYGNLEPSPEIRIKMTPEMFDLVIVPGVAFDKKGGRLGLGKGYYDRFLEVTRAFRLALAFDCQIIETVPSELHDIPMNAILSESGIVETKI